MSHICPHCGCELDAGDPLSCEPRSLAQLRRYFALVRAVYHHWPELHERQFASPTECRKWLQIRAGYYEQTPVVLTGIKPERAVVLAEAAIRAAGAYGEVILHGDALVIRRSKSIDFRSLSHKNACRLFDDVAAVIETETGISAEQYLREKAA